MDRSYDRTREGHVSRRGKPAAAAPEASSPAEEGGPGPHRGRAR